MIKLLYALTCIVCVASAWTAVLADEGRNIGAGDVLVLPQDQVLHLTSSIQVRSPLTLCGGPCSARDSTSSSSSKEYGSSGGDGPDSVQQQHGRRRELRAQGRELLAQHELQEALEGRSSRLPRMSSPEAREASSAAAAEALSVFNRQLQAAHSAPALHDDSHVLQSGRRELKAALPVEVSPASSGLPGDLDITPLLTMDRTVIPCTPDATLELWSSVTMFNLDFVGCQAVVSNPPGTQPVSFVNCVFRDTLDRPAILVQPNASVSLSSCVFYNNTYTSAPANSSSDLNNGTGSAILVKPGGRIVEISNNVFKWNGYGGGATAGGAIALSGPDACLSYVSKSSFISNGRAGAEFLYGGAIGGTGVDGCDIRVVYSNFTGNAGGRQGGAVSLSSTGVRSVNISRSNFWSNTALKDGGALHLYDAQGNVYVNRTVLDGNVAGERGGGAALEGVALAVVERCRMTNNRVYNGTGGGLVHYRPGVLSLFRTSVSYNRAVYGGGLWLSSDVDVRLAGSSEVVGNVAEQQAGGMGCDRCYMVTADSVTFRGNLVGAGANVSMTTSGR